MMCFSCVNAIGASCTTEVMWCGPTIMCYVDSCAMFWRKWSRGLGSRRVACGRRTGGIVRRSIRIRVIGGILGVVPDQRLSDLLVKVKKSMAYKIQGTSFVGGSNSKLAE
jgi:hypothetical protein